MQNNNKILIVDDEAPIRRVLEVKLKSRGYQVITATNGAKGLDMIRNQFPAVVITDIMMPELDGKTLCQQTDGLKKDRPFLTIVMTCRIASDERDWINSLHQTIFMEKPFSPSKVLECIDQYMENQI